MADADKFFQRNSAWLAPGDHVYNTDLGPHEAAFQQWVQQNKVPFDVHSGITDYDMRGFWAALQVGDPKALTAVDPNDKRLHYPDYWKTPYHESFSAESQWADPDKAPKWNEKDQLVAPDGTVIYDDRKANAQKLLKKHENNKAMQRGMKKMALGYDPTLDEGFSDVSKIAPMTSDPGLIHVPENQLGATMERMPEGIPKAPLQQVPEDQLLPERPDFYRRQFKA